MIESKDKERLKLVRMLHDRRWRAKLGLFFVEGEDAVAAATADPVDLLRAGEDVEASLLADVASAPHPPRLVALYPRRRRLPPCGSAGVGGARCNARAVAPRGSRQRRDADPNGGRLRCGGG